MVPRLVYSLCCSLVVLVPTLAAAQVDATTRSPFVLAPTIEGVLLCDAAAKNPSLKSLDQAAADCRMHKSHGASAVNRLLNQLEPGGAKGSVQVGYTLTMELLKLYKLTPKGWVIDDDQVSIFLDLIAKVPRPVVLYLSAGHFDSQGSIVQELEKDPENWMRLGDGSVPRLGYFGYRILPYTLRTDPQIAVNRYRFNALRHVAKRIKLLPKSVQERIIAFTLAGEVHHLFTDFESGMGRYQNIRVTDYHPASVADFRRWLAREYGSLQVMQQKTGLNYRSWNDVPAPSKDIRKEQLDSFGDHYDAFADGTLPIFGWLWDPHKHTQRLELFINGKIAGPVTRGLHRLDVYRAVDEITDPNVGYRVDFDYRHLSPGHHLAQIVATAKGQQHLVAEVAFTVVSRKQDPVPTDKPRGLRRLEKSTSLSGLRTHLDLPRSGQDLYFNPLARDWNRFREQQVRDYLERFHAVALEGGLPSEKLYSHQILPEVNSSWNPQLFAIGASLDGKSAWKTGLNLYGGATNSLWVQQFLRNRGIHAYGVPEFHTQQWKHPNVHIAAMRSHLDAGARFISPYYFSIVPQRFKAASEHGVNRLEIGPSNTKDGSDGLYRAILELAKE